MSRSGRTCRPRAPRDGRGADVIDAHGKLAIPGLVNSHYHSNDILARGMMEDLALDSWSMMASPLGSRRSLAEVRARTLVGAIDCLRNGITTVQDFSNFAPASEEVLDTILDAYADVGIRVVFSVTVRDKSQMDTIPWIRDIAPADMHAAIGNNVEAPGPQMEFVENQITRVGDKGGMLQWALSPSAPAQRLSPELFESVAALSKQLDLPVYTHVYETRCEGSLRSKTLPLRRLGHTHARSAGLLGPNVSNRPRRVARARRNRTDRRHRHQRRAQHAEQPQTQKRRGAGDGLPRAGREPRPGLRQLQLQRCAKPDAGDEAVLPADRGQHAATAPASRQRMRFAPAPLGGARAAGLEGVIGAIKPGYKADLVLIDLADIAYVPFNSALRQLVFSDSGRAIDTVIVNGRLIIEGRQLLSLDEAALRDEVAALMPAVRTELRACAAATTRPDPTSTRCKNAPGRCR